MTVASSRQSQGTQPLPAGWLWVPLMDLVYEAQPGFACGARDPQGTVQLRMHNLDTSGALNWETIVRVPADEAIVERYRLNAGDVLFNNTNSTSLVGKSALFAGYPEPVVYSNHFTRLRTHPHHLEPAYLAAWLVSQQQDGVFERLCNRWAGQSAVRTSSLLALQMPLPPLDQQRRIAALLAEQVAALEVARAACQAQLDAISRLGRVLQQRAFRGETPDH